MSRSSRRGWDGRRRCGMRSLRRSTKPTVRRRRRSTSQSRRVAVLAVVLSVLAASSGAGTLWIWVGGAISVGGCQCRSGY